jgi:hypothetical protein
LSLTLTVPLRPSRVFALVLTAVAGAALACAWTSLPLPAFAPLAAGIVLAWACLCAQALHLTPSAVRTLELDAAGGVRCQDGLGRWQEAQIRPGSYVSVWLVVLLLRREGRGGSLVLLPDAAAAGDLRRLRVWLRWRLVQA